MSEQDKLVKSMKSEMDTSEGGGATSEGVQYYVDKMRVFRPFREQFDQDLDDNYRMYISKYKDKLQTSPTTSELNLPIAYTTVENWLTKVAGAFFSGERVWEVVPSRDMKASNTTKPTQKLLDYQMDIYNWEYTLYDILKTVGIYGMAWVFFGWELKIGQREEEIQKPIIDKDGNVKLDELGNPKFKTEKTEVSFIDQDKPVMMNVPFKEVFWDPYATKVEDSKEIIREYFQDLDYVEKKVKEGTYKLPKGVSIEDLDDRSKVERQQTSNLELQEYDDSGYDNRRKRIQIWDVYEDTRWKTILNERHVVKDIQNPLPRPVKPCTLIRGIPLPHTMKPLSEIGVVKDLILEKNTIRNQRIDQVTLDINQMFVYDKNADIDEKDLISRPNGMVGVRPINGSVANAVVPLRKAYVQAPAYNEESFLKEDLQDTSGQLDYAVGKTPERREAAKTVGRLQDAAVSRFDITKVRVLMFQMKEIPKMIMLFNKTFLDPESLDVRVFDRASNQYSWEKLSVEDIDFNCDFRFPGSLGKSMKVDRRRELMQFIMEAGKMQNAYLAMGGKPYLDMSVLNQQYLLEGEYGELAQKAIIGPMDPNTPVSPQTKQKEEADRRKSQGEGGEKQKEAEMKAKMAKLEMQLKMKKAELEMALKTKKERQDMALKEAKGKQDLKQEEEKHDQDMDNTEDKAELEQKIAKQKAKDDSEEG